MCRVYVIGAFKWGKIISHKPRKELGPRTKKLALVLIKL